MPDLLIVDSKDRAIFIEVKYARKGVITFKKTQLPWYKRHGNLCIGILAYNDLTENVHLINSKFILRMAESLSFRLAKEEAFVIEESL